MIPWSYLRYYSQTNTQQIETKMLKKKLKCSWFSLSTHFCFAKVASVWKSLRICDVCLHHQIVSFNPYVLKELFLGFASSSGFKGNTRTAQSCLGSLPGFSFPFSYLSLSSHLFFSFPTPLHLQQLLLPQSQSLPLLCPPPPPPPRSPHPLRARRRKASMLLGCCCCWQRWCVWSGWRQERRCPDWPGHSSSHRSGCVAPSWQNAPPKKWLQCPHPEPSPPGSRSASHLSLSRWLCLGKPGRSWCSADGKPLLSPVMKMKYVYTNIYMYSIRRLGLLSALCLTPFAHTYREVLCFFSLGKEVA